MDKLTCIRTFIAVVEAGTFTAAAKSCGISKALVSKYVSALENDLNARLLQRTTRQVTITDSGALYYQRCKTLIQDLDDLDNSLKDAQENLRGLLKISAPVSFTEIKLMPVFQQFLIDHPLIRIQLDVSDHFVNLLDEQADIAIRIGQLEDSSLVMRKLTQIELILCASPDYLKIHGMPNHPDKLTEHTCFFDSNSRDEKRWSFMLDGRKHTVTPKCQLEINSARAIRELLVSHQGISMLPSFVIDKDIEEGRLVPLLETFQNPPLGVYAVYQHKKHLPAKIRLLIDTLADSFANE